MDGAKKLLRDAPILGGRGFGYFTQVKTKNEQHDKGYPGYQQFAEPQPALLERPSA